MNFDWTGFGSINAYFRNVSKTYNRPMNQFYHIGFHNVKSGMEFYNNSVKSGHISDIGHYRAMLFVTMNWCRFSIGNNEFWLV